MTKSDFKDNSFDQPFKKKPKYGAGGSDNYQRFLEFLEQSNYVDSFRRTIVVDAKNLKKRQGLL